MYYTNNICFFCGCSIDDGSGTLSVFGAMCERCKAALDKEMIRQDAQ